MLHYNAEANYLAFDGATVIKAPWRYWTYESQYINYSLISDATLWDFNKYIPEYLIINLGTNDAGIVIRGEGSLETLTSTYISFLKSIRSHYLKTTIICCYGMMGVYKDVSYAMNDAVIKMNDPNIHYFEFTPVSCTGHESHPDVNGSLDGANQLIGFIDGLTYQEQFDDSAYKISKVNEYQYKNDHQTYLVQLNKPSNSAFIKINIGKANQKISSAITVINSDKSIHLLTNSISEWFKSSGDLITGYNMGEWVAYADRSDASNYLYLRLFAKKDENISINTKIYISIKEYSEPVEGKDYVISLTSEVTYKTCDIYKITILNENEGFNALIKTASINKQINGAIMVSSTSRWVNIKTSGYDKWFKDSWNEGAWWEKTNQWDDFSYKTSDDGVINLKIGIYTRNDAGEYGPLLPGVSIYVAVNK